ncbi:unnamed protein product [Effrenium voratum]|nr:unnamed protein product [Effrenium voratum]
MPPRVADDQQTRLTATPMTSSAGSALQSLMTGKGAKSSGAAGTLGAAGERPKADQKTVVSSAPKTDQKTVVSSATHLNSTSKAGALLSSLVKPSPKSAAATGDTEAHAKPTHSDRALEEAEAKVPLLGSATPDPQASAGVVQPASGNDGAKLPSVIGALCILVLVAAVAAVVLLVKPQAHAHPQGLRSAAQATTKNGRPVQSRHPRAPHARAPAKPAPSEARSVTRPPQASSARWARSRQRIQTTQAASSSQRRRGVQMTTQAPRDTEAMAEALKPYLTDVGEAQHSGAFDCGDTQGLRLQRWSAEHIEYCCVNEDIGCGVLPATIDCRSPNAITDWSPWSDTCNACGGGERSRARRFKPAFGKCEMSQQSRTVGFFQSEPCQEVDVESFVSQWSGWGQCSVTCDYGFRERVREMSPLAHRCRLAFPLQETEPCSAPPC